MTARQQRNNFFDVEEEVPVKPARRPAAQIVEEEPEDESVPEFITATPHAGRRASARPSRGCGAGSPAQQSSIQPTAGPALGFQAPSALVGRGAGMGMVGSPQPPGPREASGRPADIGRKVAAMSLRQEELEPDCGSEVIGGPRMPARGQARPAAAAAGWAPPDAPQQPPRQQQGLARRPGAAGQMVIEDIGNLESDFGDAEQYSMGQASSRGITRSSAAVTSLRGEPVPQQTSRAIQSLLWGSHGQPPPSWQQGFFFSTKPGLRFGLVQMQGGPCGVLAAVQAHVLAALTTPAGSINLNPTTAEQQAALVSALATLLWQARSGDAVSVAVPPQHDTVGGRMTHEQLIRGAAFVTASSTRVLEDTLRGALPLYMEQNGWGVVLLLLSLMLTRAVHVVRSDMDEPDNALMGMHGYCTQELVNLILTGKAVSNVFDGDRQLDGSVLKGISRPSKLGLLTLFEWYKYVEVGSHLKLPELPIWVVCSESHFTVLFAAGAGALGGRPPFDLLYYDELANQDDIIRLTIRHDPAGGWTARVGDGFADRGKCEGQNIPPLECVIETRWPGVAVDWNGADPIL